MADTLRIKRRAVGGAAGAPGSLAAAELAYNEQDDKLYYGKGNSGGNATSIIAIGGPGAFQPLDDDLLALAALTGTNTIYYRSAAGVWTPVTFSGLTFSGGVLTATGSGTATGVITQTILASTTYAPTAGARYVTFEVGGGGAGGAGTGAGSAGNSWGGGGGGSGGYSRKTVPIATVGASIGITIGAGGNGGPASSGGSTGSAGGQTYVGASFATAICAANGGGAGAAPGTASGIPGAGATITGAVGDVVAPGQPGEWGFFGTTTNSNCGGSGGRSFFAGGGQGGIWTSSNNVANAGQVGSLGSGGGGAFMYATNTARAGGKGGDGFLVITEFF